MALFNVRTADVQPDRRVARRYVVDRPARFSTAGGEREGRLTDLSEHGARFETEGPPATGTTGFLKWAGEDCYGTIIWSSGQVCGMQFDRPIATSVVEGTCNHVEVTLKPVAAVARIPLGQRRAGRLSVTD